MHDWAQLVPVWPGSTLRRHLCIVSRSSCCHLAFLTYQVYFSSKPQKGEVNQVYSKIPTHFPTKIFLFLISKANFFSLGQRPIRKYYRYLNRQLDEDVEAGWYQNDELQSIQVVPNYPPAPYYNIPIPPPPPPPKIRKRYRKRGMALYQSFRPSEVST